MEPIIVAAIAAFASVLTAVLGYFLTKQHELRTQERRLKEEYYKFFIKALSDAAIYKDDVDVSRRFSESFNSLLVIGSPNVVKKIMEYHDLIRTDSMHPEAGNRNSSEWDRVHNLLLKEVVKAMRQDIFGRERNIDNYLSNIHLVGGPDNQSSLNKALKKK